VLLEWPRTNVWEVHNSFGAVAQQLSIILVTTDFI
jgi:hypothetical protein